MSVNSGKISLLANPRGGLLAFEPGEEPLLESRSDRSSKPANQAPV